MSWLRPQGSPLCRCGLDPLTRTRVSRAGLSFLSHVENRRVGNPNDEGDPLALGNRPHDLYLHRHSIDIFWQINPCRRGMT